MKLTILDKQTYESNGKVLVSLVCRPNLKWFEEQFAGFDSRVVRKILRKHLTAFKVVEDTQESGQSSWSLLAQQPEVPGSPKVDYEYIDSFNVVGEAKVNPNDTYDLEFGRRLAESRAKRAAYNKMEMICQDLEKYYGRLMNEFSQCRNQMSFMAGYEGSHETRLIKEKYPQE